MTIDWKRVDTELPTEHGLECLLYNDDAGHVIGPIVWHAEAGGWLDLFGPYATNEAGAMFKPGAEKGPTHWAVWNDPPEVES